MVRVICGLAPVAGFPLFNQVPLTATWNLPVPTSIAQLIISLAPDAKAVPDGVSTFLEVSLFVLCQDVPAPVFIL